MVNKGMTMAGLGAMVLAAVTIIVLYGIVPVIGYQIDTAITLPTNTAATGTFSSTSNLSNAELIANTTSVNISTETYVFTNGVAGAFKVDLSGGANNSSGLIAALVAEINTNSTLVSAVDNGDNTTTVSALIATVVGNTYATTDNATGQAWAAATMSGGVTGSTWDSATNTNLPTGPSFWTTVSGFITLGALMLFIGGFISALKGIRG